MSENNGMKNMVLTVNKLQEMFHHVDRSMDIDLPQIAVVGSQSSGKSSVLEKFIGRDFLPRGSGIVTRRPLILQLIYDEKEFAKFDHSPTIFEDFDLVKKEIESETDKVAGNKKALSSNPILLKVYSPNVVNLTLIDLPGITKVPVGDQPADIEQQVRSMILEYIEKDSCLILAVTPANTDLATSEAIKLAQEVDPKGLRTIGVITKIDIMDKGTNAVDMLENKVVPLKLGYIGVVNRSQQNIDDKVDMKAAADDEIKFFARHPSYKHMAGQMGTSYLQKFLNKHLNSHILETLPTLREKLRKRQLNLEKEVPVVDTSEPISNIQLMNDIISQLKKDFRSELEGYDVLLTNTETLTNGTSIYDIFNESIRHDNFNINFNDMNNEEYENEIATTIRNTNGMYINIFNQDKALERVVVVYIEMMKQPIENYVDKVGEILRETILKFTEKITRYPNFREELRKILLAYIANREQKCKQRLIEMINCEKSYINKHHEDFNVFKAYSVSSDDDKEDDEKFSFKSTMKLNDEDFWFILSPDLLAWYNDDDEDLMVGSIPLKDLKLGECTNNYFELVEVEGKTIYENSSVLKLSCATSKEQDDWIKQFNAIGINNQKKSQALVKHSSRIHQQVDAIKNLVKMYTTIVIKSVRDRVPKKITYLLVNNVTDFINDKLLVHFQEAEMVDLVMQITPSEQERIEKATSMYEACKDGLKIIDEEIEKINMST